jgi:hypothetical protein
MAVRDFVTVYILGYVCFEGDMVGNTPLSPDHMKSTASALARVLLGINPEMELSKGWYRTGRIPVQGSAFLGKPWESPDAKYEPSSPILRHSLLEFGYSGHRFILTLKANRKYQLVDDGETSSGRSTDLIMNFKSDILKLHEHIRRRLCNGGGLVVHEVTDRFGLSDEMPFAPGSPLRKSKILHAYTYPLVLLPNSIQPFDYDLIDGPGQGPNSADLVYADRNTTFGLYIREYERPRASRRRPVLGIGRWISDFPFLVLFRRHYIKLTTAGTWVIVDGWCISEELLDDIIDAIFVGGLHNNATADFERANLPHEGLAVNRYNQSNNWTYDLLSGVFDLMHKFVQAKDSERLRVFLSLAAVGFAFGAVVFRQALEHQLCLARLALIVSACSVVVVESAWFIGLRRTIWARKSRPHVHVLGAIFLSAFLFCLGLIGNDPLRTIDKEGRGKVQECPQVYMSRDDCSACHFSIGTTVLGSVTNVFHNETVSHRRSRGTVKPPKTPAPDTTCPKPLLPPTDSNIAK